MSEQDRDNGQEVRNAEISERPNDELLTDYAAASYRLATYNENANYDALRDEILRRMSTGNPQMKATLQCCNCGEFAPDATAKCQRCGVLWHYYTEAERSDSRTTGEEAATVKNVTITAPSKAALFGVSVEADEGVRVTVIYAAKRVIDARPYAAFDVPNELRDPRVTEAEQRDGRIEAGKGADRDQAWRDGVAADVTKGWRAAFYDGASGEQRETRVSDQSGDNGRKGENAAKRKCNRHGNDCEVMAQNTECCFDECCEDCVGQ